MRHLWGEAEAQYGIQERRHVDGWRGPHGEEYRTLRVVPGDTGKQAFARIGDLLPGFVREVSGVEEPPACDVCHRKARWNGESEPTEVSQRPSPGSDLLVEIGGGIVELDYEPHRDWPFPNPGTEITVGRPTTTKGGCGSPPMPCAGSGDPFGRVAGMNPARGALSPDPRKKG